MGAKAGKAARRRTHEALNAMPKAAVRRAVLALRPGLEGGELDRACKEAVAAAHRMVSPARKWKAGRDGEGAMRYDEASAEADALTEQSGEKYAVEVVDGPNGGEPDYRAIRAAGILGYGQR